jgi:Trk K+ transport system NAD-binding subunit
VPSRPDFIVVCGANLLASHTASYLLRLGCTVALLVPAGKRAGLRFVKTLALERIVEGDCRDPEVLRQAGVAEATAILLLNDSDLTNVEAALRVRELRADLRIVSRVFQQHLARSLDDAIPHHYSLSDSVLAAPAFALAATLSSYAGYFYLEDVSQPAEPLQLWEVAQLDLDSRHPLVGLSPRAIETHHAALVVARTSREPAAARASSPPTEAGEPRPSFFPPHDPDEPLRADEQIMVLARPDRAKGILHAALPAPTRVFARRRRRVRPESSLPGRHLAWHRRFADRLARLSPVMKLTLVVLVALLAVGVSVFSLAGIGGPDAFFFTIVVLTGGYGDLQVLQAPSTAVWVKAVASALTILGAGLVGLVYGAMTERVLSRRLGALLTDRMIPRYGHVIVCGLGNIGMRVVEELRRMRIPVVAIERKHDNPYIDAVRRMNVAVIVANAASAGVLERARVAKAHCLVGATDDDLVNLDVALAARAKNDAIRVVLRVFDHDIALPMQKMFGIDVIYSMWSLAAPAFAAAALVGRTFGAFPWKGRSVLVQELQVPPDSPIAGKRLEDVCAQYDIRGFVRGRVLDGGEGLASAGVVRTGDRVVFLGTSEAMRRVANAVRHGDFPEMSSLAPGVR